VHPVHALFAVSLGRTAQHGNMDNSFQVELIELKASYQHEMDVLDAMLQEKQDDSLGDGAALEILLRLGENWFYKR